MNNSFFNNYQTFIFDCDGVLLDSNHLKTKIFYDIALSYGEEPAKQLASYHQQNGGLSRFKKFEYFFSEILKMDTYQENLEKSIKQFGELSYQKMISCPETKDTEIFLSKLPLNSKRYVISGTAQSELRKVFHTRKLDGYFNGIYGSPRTKPEIIQQLFDESYITTPAVFFGDSHQDYEAASQFNMDFIFMSGYTVFRDWEKYFEGKENVRVISNFTDLL